VEAAPLAELDVSAVVLAKHRRLEHVLELIGTQRRIINLAEVADDSHGHIMDDASEDVVIALQ